MRHRAEPGDREAGEGPADSRVRLRVGVGAVVVLLVGALVVAVLLSAFAQRGSTVALTGPASPRPSAATGGDAEAAGLLVHVTGAVASPGIVSLHAGSRVLDAIAAAGGLAESADPEGVNLARPVADGEQLVVPRIGEVPAGAAPGAVVGADGATAVVNLNTATQAELETLPRIGPALAQRILDWRTAHGRLAAVDDLRQVTGIGQKIFDGLKDRVAV